MLLRYFVNFYDMEIIEEEAFLAWKEDITQEFPEKEKLYSRYSKDACFVLQNSFCRNGTVFKKRICHQMFVTQLLHEHHIQLK